MYKKYFKRLFDLIFATTIFILFSPICLLLTIFLAIANKGKPFFFQQRPGKNEKIFRVIKFKTMTDERGEDAKLLSDADRLTVVGRFVRITSLDEILQLLNVIKGDMSLIGPRPLLIRYLPYYTDKERIRHSIRPGITGLAQVNGRNTIEWDQRLANDVYYVEKISFLLDAKIIFLTIKSVLTGKNIVIDPSSVLENFDEQRNNKMSNKL